MTKKELLAAAEEASSLAAARPDVSKLGMIALYPTAEEAEALALYGTMAPDTMHVTMVFLGEVAEIDLKAAARAVGSASGSTAPLSGKIGGVGIFGAGETAFPQIAIPNVKGLAALRTLLVEKLAEEGIESPSEHDWVPHMTLAYIEEVELPDLGVISSPLTFSQLSLVVNDERKDFPLDPEGATDDVHRPDPERASMPRYSRAELRQRDLLIARARS